MQETTRVPLEDRQFGDMVVAQGLCSREKVDECLSFLGRLIEEGVTPVPRLGELLARKGYLSADRVDATFRPGAAGRETRIDRELPKEAADAARDPANLLGKYVKVAPLGAGGMGEVWRGWDRELRRWVALKFLHHADAAQQARFLREAQTAAALNHPNIASVYEVGEKDGKPFIAMQVVAGQTLATLPRNDLKKVVGLARDAALAVHYAHEQGVVHRDLKPHNLMIEGSRVYVMDFGLAKPTTVDSSLSASGQILGTPAYMAPEQARGDSTRVGPRSDVYALGATLYELLSDRPPHQETEVYALLKKIIDEDAVPLRMRNPRVPRDLETIVTKCLEKDPDRRYASARELADDLGRWLSGEVILAHPPSAAYQVRKFIARHPTPIALAATIFLAVAILLPVWLGERGKRRSLVELGEIRAQMLVIKEWTRQSFRTPKEIRSRLDGEIAKVDGFISRHPRLPQGYFVRAQGSLMRDRLDEAERDLRRALELEPDFAPAWGLLARTNLDKYDRKLGGATTGEILANRIAGRPFLLEALEALKKAWREGSDSTSIERWGLSRTSDDAVAERLAQALRAQYLENRPEEALRLLRQGFEESPAPEFLRWLVFFAPKEEERARWRDMAVQIAPLSGSGYRIRAEARMRAKDFQGAHADCESLIAVEPDDPDPFVERAVLWITEGKFDRALADCTRAIELDPNYGEAWINRAAAHLKRHEPGPAERDASEAIRLLPRQPLGYVNRAGARVEKGDWEGAIADATKALELLPDLAIAWSSRAAARLHRRDLDGAIADCDKAIELDAAYAMAYVNRAGARLEKGDGNGALKDADKAVELDPTQALAYTNRGMALMLSDFVEAASSDFNRAIELDPKVALAYAGRAGASLKREDWDSAIRDCDRAIELDPGLFIAYSNRGGARLAKEDHEGALADATKAVELSPGRHEPYIIRGLSRQALKDKPRAIADLQTALKLAPAEWPYRKDVEQMLENIRAGTEP